MRKAEHECVDFLTNVEPGVRVAHTQKPKQNLAEALRALKDTNIIDQRLFEWSESLREERNIGAYAGEKTVNPRDAKDVMDFALAICEYVYVLADKYEEYKKREQPKS